MNTTRQDEPLHDDAGTVVVVGGGRGIGATIADVLARQPWCDELVVADVDGVAAQERARALASEVRTHGVALDIADAAAVEAFVDATAGAGYVAIPAGIFAAAPSLDVDKAAFERILAVNLVGVFGVAQGYAARMAERGGGSIVAIASIAARMPRMRQAAYCASKAGVRQALRVLAMEVASRGVRINTVSPGPTDTPMMRELAKDHPSVDYLAVGSPEAFRPPIPDGRVARPRDIANATAFLLSPEAGHITLHDLVVDGGELLGV